MISIMFSRKWKKRGEIYYILYNYITWMSAVCKNSQDIFSVTKESHLEMRQLKRLTLIQAQECLPKTNILSIFYYRLHCSDCKIKQKATEWINDHDPLNAVWLVRWCYYILTRAVLIVVTAITDSTGFLMHYCVHSYSSFTGTYIVEIED